jgi:hypothetical protein
MAEITAQLRLPKGKSEGGMKFGPASPARRLAASPSHDLRRGSLVLKKGTTIGPPSRGAEGAGQGVVVVRLEPGDVSEDVAAASIAQAVAGEGVMSSAPSPAAPICSRQRRRAGGRPRRGRPHQRRR